MMRRTAQLLIAAVAMQAMVVVAGSSAQARETALTSYEPGTIVVKTSERRLYLMLGNGQMKSYTVGVGKAGKTWTGVSYINGKYLRPAWSPPEEVRHDKPSLPAVI